MRAEIRCPDGRFYWVLLDDSGRPVAKQFDTADTAVAAMADLDRAVALMQRKDRAS